MQTQEATSAQSLSSLFLLADLTVGLSISNSPRADLASRGLSPMHLDHAFVELTRHLLAHGATVAYGGDHRVDGFTQILFDLVRTYDREDKPAVERIRTYLTWPLQRSLVASKRNAIKDVATLIEVPLPDDLQNDRIAQNLGPLQRLEDSPGPNRRLWARCLTCMRRSMNNEIDARIILGGRYGGLVNGKLDPFLGKYPGIVEEAHLAITAQKPVYLLGGFGGCAKIVIDGLLGQSPAPLTLDFHKQADPVYWDMVENYPLAPDTSIDYEAILKDFQQASISGLQNGLDEQDNWRLFVTDDIDEMIALVLKGLTSLA